MGSGLCPECARVEEEDGVCTDPYCCSHFPPLRAKVEALEAEVQRLRACLASEEDEVAALEKDLKDERA